MYYKSQNSNEHSLVALSLLTCLFKLKRKEFPVSVLHVKSGGRINKFQLEGQSSVMDSVIKTEKPSEFKLKNTSTEQKKTLSFKKHDMKSYSSLLKIFNELQQYEHVHIVRETGASPKEVKNGLSLKELKVMDDDKTIMTLTVFGDMIQNVELN